MSRESLPGSSTNGILVSKILRKPEVGCGSLTESVADDVLSFAGDFLCGLPPLEPLPPTDGFGLWGLLVGALLGSSLPAETTTDFGGRTTLKPPTWAFNILDANIWRPGIWLYNAKSLKMPSEVARPVHVRVTCTRVCYMYMCYPFFTFYAKSARPTFRKKFSCFVPM